MMILALACTPTAITPTDSEADLLDRYALSDELEHPEGTAFDPAQRAFFVGSLGNGALTRIDPDGTEHTVYTPDTGWSSLGMKVSAGQLFTCAVHSPSTPEATSALWVTDLADDTTEVFPLADAPNNCNDVLPDGDDVYLTDRESGRLHHVDLSTGAASVWLQSAELEPDLIGNNGIVKAGDALLVGQYNPPRLLRIPLDAPEALTVVDLDPAAFGTFPNGADGIAWNDEELVVAANRRVVRLTSNDDWSSAVATFTELDVGIAAVTVAEGRVYGLKGEVVAYVLGTPADLPFELFAL